LVVASIAQRFGLLLIPGKIIVPGPELTLRPQSGIVMTVWHRHQVEENALQQ
jgi:hypothetical protein